jgi:hypothetical protein
MGGMDGEGELRRVRIYGWNEQRRSEHGDRWRRRESHGETLVEPGDQLTCMIMVAYIMHAFLNLPFSISTML